jgi:hypothetical protein
MVNHPEEDSIEIPPPNHQDVIFHDPTPKMKILSNGILEVSRSILLKLPYWFKPFYQ